MLNIDFFLGNRKEFVCIKIIKYDSSDLLKVSSPIRKINVSLSKHEAHLVADFEKNTLSFIHATEPNQMKISVAILLLGEDGITSIVENNFHL